MGHINAVSGQGVQIMSKAHTWLLKYLKSQFKSVRYTCNPDQTVTVTDSTGQSMIFGINLYADILDCSTDPPQLVATSDCSHDWETMSDSEEPTAWKNNPAYFG